MSALDDELPLRHPSLDSIVLRPAASGAVVDLREIAWFDPVHLVSVAALCYELADIPGGLRVLAPLAPQVARYAGRLRLGAVLDDLSVQHDLPAVDARPLPDQLLELSLVDQPHRVQQLAALVRGSVVDRDPVLADALFDCLGELGDNVEQHSGTAGFAAAQTLGGRGVIRFAVADAGVGLLGTLRSRGASNDEQATRMALSGISSRPGALGGWGLPHVVDLVSRLGGSMFVASGEVSAVATTHAIRIVHGSTFGGTVLEGSIPLIQDVRSPSTAAVTLSTIKVLR
ncbi:MAG: hypothetical protein ACRC35_00525 [Angustibacter sp.]